MSRGSCQHQAQAAIIKDGCWHSLCKGDLQMILLSWKLASFVFVQRVEMRQQSDKFNITFIKISVCKAISIVRMKTK